MDSIKFYFASKDGRAIWTVFSVGIFLLLLSSSLIVSVQGPLAQSMGSAPPSRKPIDLKRDMNISEVSLASFIGEGADDDSGYSVSDAGDVNGDGYGDILIGAYQNSEGGPNTGQTYLIFGKTSGWSMDTDLSKADASFIGEDAGDMSGCSVSGAGDVNGDGYDDILIGAKADEDGGLFAGQTYLILGRASGWSMDVNLSNANASFIGENADDSSAYSVSGAGDVNKDGYDDIIIGAYHNNDGAPGAGQTYLILGKTSGWSMDTDLSNADASFIGETLDDFSGFSVSGAGDVNGDGYDDIIIGAFREESGGMDAGQTYLVLGKASGWTMNTPLLSADASYIGEGPQDNSGISVSGAGDVNGDGYDDFLIGAYYNDQGGSNAGQTYLILGKASGWAKDVDLSAADASFIGEDPDDWSGISVSGAGDVNDDGYDDFLIGAHNDEEAGSASGQTYLIIGKASGWSMDSDLSLAFASFRGEGVSDWSGWSVSGAGDVDKDGFDDILIGAFFNDEGGSNSGQSYLISGLLGKDPSIVYNIVVKNELGGVTNAADILETVNVEVTGKDSDPSRVDRARVNVTFGSSKPSTAAISLRETDIDTGMYKGSFRIPSHAQYLETIRFSAYIDKTKFREIIVDYPFRPTAISSIGVFKDSACTKTCTKSDLLDTITFQVGGVDANNMKKDKAFIDITSDKDPNLDLLMVLNETGIQTGKYRGSFLVPSTMRYFENLTISSVEDPLKTAKFMIHTPVSIRSSGGSNIAYEDLTYSESFYNFGYNSVIWSAKLALAYWLSWDPDGKTISGTPSNMNIGTWTIRIEARDGEGNIDILDWQIDVINTPASIMTRNLISIKEGEEYYVDYNSDDDLMGNITWYLNTDAKWLSMDKSTGVLSGKPSNEDVGVIPVKVTVDDGNNGRNWTDFNLTVLDVNQKPSIITDDITTIYQDTPFIRDYDASDPDLSDTQNWSVITDASWLSMESDTGVLSGTPTGLDVGVYYVIVTVTDRGMLNDSRMFPLTVLDKKEKPTWIDVPPKEVSIRNGLVFVFDANATDYDGDAISFSVVTDPKSDLRIDPDTGVIQWKASVRSLPKGAQSISVSIKASDGDLFNSYIFTINILSTDPPTVTLSSPADKARTPSGSTVLTWSGNDPENETIYYNVYLSSSDTDVMGRKTGSLALVDSMNTTYIATGLISGSTYYWIVIPNDGGPDGSCPEGMRSFKVNSPPRISPLKDVTATTGSSFKLKVMVSDIDPEDAQNLKSSLTKYPEGMTIDERSGIIKWNPRSNQTGDRSVTVQVKDGVESVSYSFNIVVKQGTGSSLPIIPMIIGIMFLLIVIGAVIFIVLRKKAAMQAKDDKGKGALDETAEIIAAMERHQQGETTLSSHAPEVVHSDVPLTVAEAHAQLGRDRPKTYEDLYGAPAPKEEEGLTASELKDEIGKMADELETK